MSSLFQPDSSVHIRLGLKDRTYLEHRENTYTRAEKERGFGSSSKVPLGGGVPAAPGLATGEKGVDDGNDVGRQ